ncbi:actin-like ATPase domain-containing protein [Lepidopterella palustris CBS 459.81]|uniref:Actin-like ATPase domain-containing protein n=1 Tax=Lepidopterella palustris CBS 459.81 TaxID=1314670 RepID=A0A8E2JEJ7_9PEZI|nr:actin-like ATPase domain-containing protein [Lepidopterella palustris CBS 459.81]
MASRITIGVDFGTTYSGVAYSHPKDETKEPLLITEWGSGPSSEKVPTILRYNLSDSIGGLAGVKWGYQVKHHERRQEWFKLDLDPMVYKAQDSVDLTQSYASELAELPDAKRTPQTLVTDYLTCLKKQAMKSLAGSYDSNALNRSIIEWVITTPAVWSQKAKLETLACAEKAGMGKGSAITLVSEPEAAAAYCIKMMQPVTLQPGNNIVICDAGGGTVDLITYRITNLSPLEVEESAIKNGGKCGGVFVNRIFQKMIEKRLGANSGLTDIGKHQLMNHFETYVKREFEETGDPGNEHYLPVPGARQNRDARVSGNNMLITEKDMKQVFDPVIQEVIKLVKNQISGIQGGPTQRNVSAVLLVGGFGQSRYLKKKLQEAIGPITLLCPANGWSAIARGAVIQGIATRSSNPEWRVTSRKSDQHFGALVNRPFVEGKHDSTRKYYDSLEGIYRCRDLMQWFINRGEDLSSTVYRRFYFYRKVEVIGGKWKWNEALKASFDTSEDGPEYFDNGVCRNHITMKVDFSTVPKEKFEKKVGANGKEYYRIDYAILAKFESASVEYKVEFNNEITGSIKATYDQ